MNPITRIALVRHGETDWNREHRIQGWTDVPLNAKGHTQAARLADELASQPFTAIFSSTLARAHQTAQPVADRLQLPIQLDERLRERHLGALQGLTRQQISQHHPELNEALDEHRPNYQPPGGESIETFSGRVISALQAIAAAHPGGTVLLVAHGGVLDCALRWVRSEPWHTPRTASLPNAALNWFSVQQAAWRVEAFGLTDHLRMPSSDDQGG